MLSVTSRGECLVSRRSAHQELHSGPFPCRGNVLLTELCAVCKNDARTRSRTSVCRLSIGCSAVELYERGGRRRACSPSPCGLELLSKQARCACPVHLPKTNSPVSSEKIRLTTTFTHLPLSGSPQVFHGGVWDSWPASLLATWTVLPSYVFFANKKTRTFSGPGFFKG